MANFRHNIKGNKFVIIAPARVTRPHDSVAHPQNSCPFCPGNERLNKEVFVIRHPGTSEASDEQARGFAARIYSGKKILSGSALQNDVILEPRRGGAIGSSNWLIRVITNKYPLTEFHEVIIHSPDHEKDIDELPLKQVELILQTYRQRYNYNKRFGTVLIFNNHDIHAGASLEHPHSQVVVVPPEISVENIVREPVANVVMQSSQFTAYCPDYSEWPYEVWITPREDAIASLQHDVILEGAKRPIESTFGHITDDQISDLAVVLQKILKAIVNKFKRGHPGGQSPIGSSKTDASGEASSSFIASLQNDETDIPYNFYIYHGQNWYLRIIPRFIHRAGFELGTGILVNIVDPKTAAEEYKEGISQNQSTNDQHQ